MLSFACHVFGFQGKGRKSGGLSSFERFETVGINRYLQGAKTEGKAASVHHVEFKYVV